ncbi:MAG: hypothetical protein PHP28_01440 [Actinomycetota bacterium]|nr:hypothetical protein [Actinomycetota bacterium]MDD5666133.1 hypothetical protein [Actinomycetota bacterium]
MEGIEGNGLERAKPLSGVCGLTAPHISFRKEQIREAGGEKPPRARREIEDEK